MLKRFAQFLVAAALVVAITPTARADQALDPVTLVTNAVLNYPTASSTIDTLNYDVVTCEVNLTAGNPRAVIPKCYAEAAGTTLTFTYPTLTVATASSGRYVFDPRTSAATADTNVVDSPNVPCRFLRITAAAAGPGTISCTKRTAGRSYGR